MSNQNKHEKDFDLLCNLLLGAEKNKIESLEQHFDDPVKHIADVSSVLPQAIKLSTSQSNDLSDELMPVVENAIKVSVKRDINVFADALYPVMGPAIRKSISEALMQMMQSINKALEHSFSLQGIKWRFEAWRSGKPFAEIVLLHSLVYRVEQIFLIHKKTGLLLHHTALAEVVQQDADLISAMLTAIQDFVLDSFNDSLDDSQNNTANNNMDNKNNSEHSLNQISMGEFSIWIEQGPDAVIAAVLKGTAPKTLRLKLITTLENIHQQYALAMQNFNGDEAAFNQVEEQLQSCLLSQYQSEKKAISWMTWGVLGGMLLGIMAWVFIQIQEMQHWQNYVQLIKSEPGIVVTDISNKDGQYIIRGLRDSLAREARQILSASSLTQPVNLGFITINPLNAEQIVHYFEPYQSMNEAFIHKRAVQLLQPPVTADVQVKEGILIVTGKAALSWIKQLKKQSTYIAGINQLNMGQLRPIIDISKIKLPGTVQLNIEGDNIIATGHAPYNWIMATRIQIKKLPGVKKYDDSQLQADINLSSLDAPEGVKFDYNTGLLSISGSAPEYWVNNIEKYALSISGVHKVNFDKLVNSDIQLLKQLKQDLEAEVIFYAPGQSNYRNASSNINSDGSLKRILSKVQLLIQQANHLSIKLQIIIQGFSDSYGHYSARVKISYLRAEHIRQFFINNGINASLLDVQSMVIKDSSLIDSTEQENSLKRRVSFSVNMLNKNNKKEEMIQ